MQRQNKNEINEIYGFGAIHPATLQTTPSKSEDFSPRKLKVQEIKPVGGQSSFSYKEFSPGNVTNASSLFVTKQRGKYDPEAVRRDHLKNMGDYSPGLPKDFSKSGLLQEK